MSDVTTKLYLVEIMDRDGDRKIVKAFGQHHRETAVHQLRKAKEQVQPAGPRGVGEPDLQALQGGHGSAHGQRGHQSTSSLVRNPREHDGKEVEIRCGLCAERDES